MNGIKHIDMDYEKKYNNALNLAKSYYGKGSNEFLDTMFPELRESEDERIRKELIAILKASYNSGITLNNKKDLDGYLAYLEKQKDASKAIEAVDRIDKYIDEHVANAHDMKDSNPDKKYYRGWDDALAKMSEILQDVYLGEKQKGQKVDIDKLRRDIYQSGYNDGYQHGKEDAQKEQKLAIKLVFPRFRVGDIIRNVHDECDKTTKRISYVGEHGYNFDYRHLGDKAGGGSFGFCYEDYYELVEQKPAVEQQGGTFNSYDMAKTFAEGQYYVMKHPEKFCLCKPAEWSDGDERIIDTIVSVLGQYIDYKAVSGTGSGYATPRYAKEIDWLNSLRTTNQWWGKEDEEMRKLLIAILEVNHPDGFFKANELGTTDMRGVHTEEIISWLKSLSLNLKKKNEGVAKLCSNKWSEEDEYKLKQCIRIVSGWERDYDIVKSPYSNFLKSLRPQPKAELTQLDENIIEAAVAFVEQNDHFNVWRGIDKYTVLKALRSLKPYWKPSEEQMCYLKKVYESYDFCDGERDALESLYNDLKKLI